MIRHLALSLTQMSECVSANLITVYLERKRRWGWYTGPGEDSGFRISVVRGFLEKEPLGERAFVWEMEGE